MSTAHSARSRPCRQGSVSIELLAFTSLLGFLPDLSWAAGYAFDAILIVVAGVGWKRAFDAEREAKREVDFYKALPKQWARKAEGFTLIEMLVASALALVILGSVITLFGTVSNSITDSRSMLEAAERLRLAEQRLQMDLAGITVAVNPPRKPEANEGYLEILEGPATATTGVSMNTEVSPAVVDTTVGDYDDILMFTTRSTAKPFIGKCGSTVAQSDVAEVAWFLRGRTLHRRVLLVKPGVSLPATSAGYYAGYDVSAHEEGGRPVANLLGDLTRRECRFAHPTDAFLFDARRWGQCGMPTLLECSSPSWTIETIPPATPPSVAVLDFWTNDESKRLANDALATGGTRVSDDIILTNVIGFDVRLWDEKQNDYVDLGSGGGNLSGMGQTIVGTPTMARVYDTWSTTYFGTAWNDGLDNDSNGIVDDDAERTNPPPYQVPLRGIHVKIRTFEPDSKQIREVTVVQDFLRQ